MNLLQSSILGMEFVNYRKSTSKSSRLQFSHQVRGEGIGNVPIVVDSVDKELTEALSYNYGRYKMYGREMVFHMDSQVASVLKEVEDFLIEIGKESLINQHSLVLGLEDGSIAQQQTDLGTLYKAHKNKQDHILYLLLTRETTMYGYILSIIHYLGNTISKALGALMAR
jgi:hypothetical protein